MVCIPVASGTASPKTTVACSSDTDPTPRGCFPSFTSVRVVLSIAVIWSVSNVYRKPKV